MINKKPNYPETKNLPVNEKMHGVSLRDEFRWLEGDAEGKITPEVAEWTGSLTVS